MNWLEIAVTVSSEAEEAVTDLFYRQGCKGVAVEAPELIQGYIDSGFWDYYDFPNIELSGKYIIKGYFPEDEYLGDKLISLREELFLFRETFPEWGLEFDDRIVKEEDWENEWKSYFKPIRIGKNFLIKPSWEEVVPGKGDLVIELDPGMAFGTGTHPTTSLCLEAIEEHVQEGFAVFDIGTGSGILAVAAAKKGAVVQAGDIDPLAVRIAKENVILNRVNSRVQVRQGNLGEIFVGQADVVVANIIADVIIELLPQLPQLLKTNGLFIASGLIDTRAEEVIARIEKAGFKILGQSADSGWVLLKARKDLKICFGRT